MMLGMPCSVAARRPEVGLRRRSDDTGGVLRVLCSESELGEHGEAVAVGDRIARSASRIDHAAFGTALDEVEWRLDRDAVAAGPDAVTVSGVVHSISAVYVDLIRLGDCTWAPATGSAHLEPLTTTAATRRPEAPTDRGAAPALDRFAAPLVVDGDERLSGWLLTLDEEAVAPA